MTKLRTKKAIAAALHISRTTLDAYLDKPGAPKEGPNGWDFAKVSRWISKTAKNTATTAKSNPELAALKIRELQLKCDRLAHKLETEQGLYIAKADIGPALHNLALNMRSLFQRKAENEMAPRLAGRTELEITAEMKRLVDDVCEINEEGIREWLETPPAAE
jgi:hypothetical protein